MKLSISRILAAILVIISVAAAASGCTTAAPVAASVEPTQAAASLAPATEAPATVAPATIAPATETPATEAPTTEAPATEAPATKAPATKAPATKAPATEAPTKEPASKDYGQIGSDLMKAESLGSAKLGMTESELLAKAGQPDTQSDAEIWGADGMKHSDWTYKDKGLTVNMTETSNPESEFVVYSITAAAPCDLATQKGVMIGDDEDAVMAAYGDSVDPEKVTDDRIIAGTEFGGVVFTMKDGQVTGIFIGAAAE